MPSKGERTREEIIQQAAVVFNRQGFAGASISDIMRETGLEKGGIYNHFASKEALALEAFDYAFGAASQRMLEFIAGERSPLARLLGIVRFWRTYYGDPPVEGGCALLNTAIDSDDTQPALRRRAQEALGQWHDLIARTVRRGVERGEIQAEAQPNAIASLIIASVEGGYMMSKLTDDPTHIERVVDHLEGFIEESVAA